MLGIEYNDEVKKLEEGKKVSYLTTAEWVGLERGLEQGCQEGRQEGRNEGRQEGEAAILLSLLQSKFITILENYLQLVHNADEPKLMNWAKKILSANTLEEVFN